MYFLDIYDKLFLYSPSSKVSMSFKADWNLCYIYFSIDFIDFSWEFLKK